LTQQHFGRVYGSNAAENYERYFVPAIGRPVADDLMSVAALQPRERVLDVGCGTGVVTRLAAERTGSTVTGLDMNPGMLEVARSITSPEMSIEWHQSSAEAMPLSDEAYDVVLCGLSLQFFPDKPAALREMRRVLAPGGRLVLNVPGRTPRIFEIMDDALARHVGSEAATFVRAVFSLHDPNEVRSLISDGGFRDVAVQTRTQPLRVPAPEEFLWQYLHATPLAEAVGKMDDERLAALERDVVESAQDLVEDGGIAIQQGIVVATARR
jgi:ubiquinone/menaquinone biosynthesis C-methylase UbiE